MSVCVCAIDGLGDKQEVACTSASALREFGPTDFDQRYQLGEIFNCGRYLIIPLYLPFQKARQTPDRGLAVGVCTLEGMACLKGTVRPKWINYSPPFGCRLVTFKNSTQWTSTEQSAL